MVKMLSLSLCKCLYTVSYLYTDTVFGEGLSGKATYSFQLVFCEPVNTEVRHCPFIGIKVHESTE